MPFPELQDPAAGYVTVPFPSLSVHINKKNPQLERQRAVKDGTRVKFKWQPAKTKEEGFLEAGWQTA